jgi:tetratricopeptide (TPR) repeat protein
MIIRAAKAFLIGAVVVLLVGAPAFSQAGRGKGRLGGFVLDAGGNPIEGAKVTLTFTENQDLVFEETTGKKGQWSFIGLGTGNWTLTVKAAGYLPADKVVNVSQLSVNPRVEITLEKAAEGSGVLSDETSVEFLEEGNALYKEGRYDEAIAAYLKFLETNPGLYQIQVSIADCHREKGEFEKAIELYNGALAQAENDAVLGQEIKAKAQAGIGNCYLKQGNLQEAQDFFRKSIENSPDDEILAYNVGEIYFSNQNLDDALHYFDLAAKIKPEWPDPYLKLGYVFLNKGDNPKAVEQFEKFLSLEPEGERAGLARNILNVIKK